MIVIDTHIWVWWVLGDRRLDAQRRAKLERGGGERVGIPDVCLFEAAMLIERRRLEIPVSAREWITKALGYPNAVVLPINAASAAISASLPWHHKDPFDRLILAAAISAEADLMTDDRLMRLYRDHVKII